ncbi:hypothetical protein AVEN_210460-1 [Araneus ventricosus]|uniref:STPR domain-containing protein n=1 Tax=Araneus ventricosus TaxID=182803 RepID=A0A4Y2HSJ0_ARAVE|nr:hypothetical protein AVEN_210460-1 [Araneus ventricosus]
MAQRGQERRAEETEEQRNSRLAVMGPGNQQGRAEETEEQRNSRLYSLITLTSRFETTRGLIWKGPHNSEPLSDDHNDMWPANPLSKFSHHTSGRTFDPPGPHTWCIFSDIRFRALNAPAPKLKPYH